MEGRPCHRATSAEELTVKWIDHESPANYPLRVPGPATAEDVVIPALLRAARGSYSQAINAKLEAAGFADLPRNGAFVLGGMGNHGGTAVDMIRGLGVTKQAASQLIDTLVLRGYLTRDVNPEDRRRMTIALTERGRAAAAAVRSGVELIDAELARMITPSELAGLRAGLEALGHLRDRMADAP
jgi:DNA-binding MarR family transcriptional regulator